MILIHNLINSTLINLNIDFNSHPNLRSLEIIAVEVILDNKKLVILSCYVSPPNVIDTEDWDYLFEIVGSPVIYLGDFNAHHSSWGCTNISGSGRALLNAVNKSDLLILNDGRPTKIKKHNEQPTAIDLTLLSSSLRPLATWDIIEDPNGSDHLPILTEIQFNSGPKFFPRAGGSEPEKVFYGWKEKVADWEQFYDSLYLNSLDFTFELQDHNVLEYYSQFIELIRKSANSTMKEKFLKPTNKFI